MWISRRRPADRQEHVEAWVRTALSLSGADATEVVVRTSVRLHEACGLPLTQAVDRVLEIARRLAEAEAAEPTGRER